MRYDLLIGKELNTLWEPALGASNRPSSASVPAKLSSESPTCRRNDKASSGLCTAALPEPAALFVTFQLVTCSPLTAKHFQKHKAKCSCEALPVLGRQRRGRRVSLALSTHPAAVQATATSATRAYFRCVARIVLLLLVSTAVSSMC